MAEDQGVNGDIWNAEFSLFLQDFGWEKVGDSNIDVENVSEQVMGLDSLFRYEFPMNDDSFKGVIVEAKCYKTTSFSLANFRKWIITLDKKISALKFDSNFKSKFPA